MACILTGCTALAVILWVALAHQHKRINRARAKAQQEAAAQRAALALPVIIVQPDDSAAFGAKLYRTPSGDMRPFSQYIRPAVPPQQQSEAQPAAASSTPRAEQEPPPAAASATH
ncbi:Collagen adhesion [Chlorella sorokiniana]|uniref:Collagen adhesion n=1 Tax=Chlorella sorokiniana TaxID=3076 RepID=A0A2P6TMJ1_CHLSO|nr:Collagen adhesion [Chlorella sorokiniana]|eukprot:PRW45554.1 Collagen adhesion [Chlorella sorokiniana]